MSAASLEGARCADPDADPELWHSDAVGAPGQAAGECRLCPVLVDCLRETDRLDAAVGVDQIRGVRAALTGSQRRARRSALELARAAGIRGGAGDGGGGW